MAVLQQAGRIALAKAVAAQTIHIASGPRPARLDAAPEPEPITANALVDEIGRRLVTEVRFARPDDNGEIELPSGAALQRQRHTPPPSSTCARPSASTTPRARTCARWACSSAPRSPRTCRPASAGVLASQLTGKGELYTLERRPRILRSGSVRQVEEIILPF